MGVCSCLWEPVEMESVMPYDRYIIRQSTFSCVLPQPVIQVSTTSEGWMAELGSVLIYSA